MNKQQAIKNWKEALSKYQQNKFHESNLNWIESFEIQSEVITIKVGNNLFECSFADLAKETGRTIDYLQLELRNYSDEEAQEFFEISFLNQNNIETFFIELMDAVISMKRIFLIDQDTSSWVDELQSCYTNIWQLAPNVQPSPFPTEKDFPNLEDYSVSFVASAE